MTTFAWCCFAFTIGWVAAHVVCWFHLRRLNRAHLDALYDARIEERLRAHKLFVEHTERRREIADMAKQWSEARMRFLASKVPR